MKSFTVWVLALTLCSSAAFAQTLPTAEARRFTRGVVGNSFYQSAVIPGDQQRGVELNPTGNNAALYGNLSDALLPWFCRIQRDQCYHMTTVQTSGVAYGLFENPLAAFGELGGGTPLYTNRDYRFGIFAGGRDYTNSQSPIRGIFRIRAYSTASLASSQTNVAPTDETTFELPWPGDANWDQFLLNGAGLLPKS